MNPTATSPRDCQHGRHARACETCAADAEIADLRAEVERERAARQQAQTQLEQTKAERNRSGIEARREVAERMRALEADLDQAKRSLALVQQHHTTAWNRGHTMGMAAARDQIKKARDAVASDAWGNTQLTDALLAAEAERDELRAEVQALKEDAERYRWLRDTPGSFTVFAEACSESMDEDVDAARKDAP